MAFWKCHSSKYNGECDGEPDWDKEPSERRTAEDREGFLVGGKCKFDTESFELGRGEMMGSAIYVFLHDNVVTFTGNGENNRADGGHAGAEKQSIFGVLQSA